MIEDTYDQDYFRESWHLEKNLDATDIYLNCEVETVCKIGKSFRGG